MPVTFSSYSGSNIPFIAFSISSTTLYIISYVFIGMLYCLAISIVFWLALTLNPIIKASDALARTISLSVIAPTAPLITDTFTPSTDIFSKEFFTASKLPFTSAFKTIFISFIPSWILPNKSSKVIPEKLLSFSRLRSFLSSAICLACFSDSKAMNLSPALGTSEIPVTSTGVDGVASTMFWPKSFLRVRTLPKELPITIGSPKRSVPFWINKVTTEPTLLSFFDSITAPEA